MKLDLNEEQLKILLDLLDSRIREIHPEIRRSRVHSFHDQLARDLEMLHELQEHLKKMQQGEEA